MRPLLFWVPTVLWWLDLSRRVDEQQFHRGYTRVAMVMVFGAVCAVLAICGAVGGIVLLLRR